MRILLVEDDATLGDGLRAGLRHEGLAVDWVRDGAAETAPSQPSRSARWCSISVCHGSTVGKCCGGCGPG